MASPPRRTTLDPTAHTNDRPPTNRSRDPTPDHPISDREPPLGIPTHPRRTRQTRPQTRRIHRLEGLVGDEALLLAWPVRSARHPEGTPDLRLDSRSSVGRTNERPDLVGWPCDVLRCRTGPHPEPRRDLRRLPFGEHQDNSGNDGDHRQRHEHARALSPSDPFASARRTTRPAAANIVICAVFQTTRTGCGVVRTALSPPQLDERATPCFPGDDKSMTSGPFGLKGRSPIPVAPRVLGR